MDLKVRKANDCDLPDIFSLIKELAVFEKGLDNVSNTLEQMYVEKDLFECFVAETEKDGIVGMALYFFTYYTWVGKSLYLEDLYVKESYRGKGIGKILLNKIIEEAKIQNCKRLRLQVLDWNQSAIEFYEKNGFTVDKTWYNCDIRNLN